MLVLYRKEGESFWLDRETQIKILEISNSGVRIGIEALDRVLIERHEKLMEPDKRTTGKPPTEDLRW